MRPVVVAAILLLMVPMSILEWTPAEMCKTKYKTPCKKHLGDNWFQMGKRCVKAFYDKHLSHHEAEVCPQDDEQTTFEMLTDRHNSIVSPSGGYNKYGSNTISDDRFACRKIKSGEFQGHLVSIHSLVELCQVECAMYKIQTGKAHYWIGLFKYIDRFGALIWIWTDKTKVHWHHYAFGQPDNFLFREGCVEMNYWSWGLWNDEQCGSRRPYVCAVRV